MPGLADHLQVFLAAVFLAVLVTVYFSARPGFLAGSSPVPRLATPPELLLNLRLSASSLLDKFWYCRLSPNHKVLHYGDLEESPQGEVPHDSLQDKRE